MTSIHTILHPTDFSPSANQAFQAACSIARDRGAQLIVLHAMAPVRFSNRWLTLEFFSPSKRERLEALGRLRERAPEIRIEPVLRKGRPARVILEVAREIPCDLIVMGTEDLAGHERSSQDELVAEVDRLAPCPVLGVKLPTAKFSGHKALRRFLAT